jgi:hypothetical protein
MRRRLDVEIRIVEARIARARTAIAELADASEEALRNAVASPRTLLGVVAFGFAVGVVLRSRRLAGGAPATRSLLGLFAGVAGAFVRARYGSPWTLVASVLSRARRPVRETPRLAQAPNRDGHDAPGAASTAAS